MNQLLVFILVTYDSIIINNHNNSYKHYFYFYSLLHVYLSNVVARDVQVNCRGIVSSFLYSSFPLYTCMSRRKYVSPSRKKKWIWSFPPAITSLVYVTEYIYIMYISTTVVIYITHIYLSIPYKCISLRQLACPLSLFIYAYL